MILYRTIHEQLDTVVTKAYRHGYSINEIADLTGLARTTVYRILRRTHDMKPEDLETNIMSVVIAIPRLLDLGTQECYEAVTSYLKDGAEDWEKVPDEVKMIWMVGLSRALSVMGKAVQSIPKELDL